jgi:hypothetical protein
MEDLSNFVASDIVTEHESQFALPDLLSAITSNGRGRAITERERWGALTPFEIM